MAKAIVALALALQLQAAPAYAHHSYPATYTGTAATGGTVDFDVNSDGTAVTRFRADSVPTTCGNAAGTVTGTFTITNHAFSNQPSVGLRFAGSFQDFQVASGTLTVRTISPICTSAPVTWTATTTAPLPPQCDDGEDNDGDGLIDYPADPGCISKSDDTETAPDTTPPDPPTITDTDPNSPANDNQPEVKGNAEAGSTVTLYQSSNCSGAVEAQGSAAAFASPGLTASVADNQPHQFSATATDAAGNTSACSTPFAYTEDSAAPAAPTITDTDPNSPANDNQPEVKGNAEAGSTVTLYQSSNCSGAVEAQGSAAAFASPGLTASVADNQTHQFSATATDAAGNTSACSTPFAHTEDSAAPAAPTITDTDPNSPANDNQPEVKGNAEAGSTVTLYQSSNCSGAVEAQGSAAAFASPGLTASVADNQPHQFSATATDAAGNTSACSTPFAYTEDSAAPAAPTITDTDPNSPANDNQPEVKGNAEAGSTVTLYQSSNCSGAVEAQGSAAAFASPGLTASVADNQTHQFSATATDAAGNTSACSTPFAYTEDSAAPAAPTITDTDPNSPANDNQPEVKGNAEAGSTVTLYQSSNCSGAVEAQGSAAAFASPGLTASVADNQTHQFSATATDAAGNTSACSTPFAYTEDSAAPAAPTITDTDPNSPANDNQPEVKGNAEAGSTVTLYQSSNCSGAVEAQGSAAAFASPGLTASVADNQTHQFSATATDAAGNTSACSTPFAYTEDSAPLPTLTIANATVTEGDSGTRNASFTVTLSAASAQQVTVNYATANGTATAPADYSSASGTLSFAPGELTKQVTVAVQGDTVDEPDETFTVNLSGATGATIADPQGLGTILDDDAPADTIAPHPPTFTGTDPRSPANNNNPRVKGTSVPNSIVRLYTTVNCSGNPAATGAAVAFASPGLVVSVADNSTTTFYATATDEAGNASGCSASSITYVEESLPVDVSVPIVQIAGKVVKMNSAGAVHMTLSCPFEPGGCSGNVSLETLGKLRVSKVSTSRKPRRRKVKLGKRSFQVAGGRTATVKVRLSKKNQRLVLKLKKVRVLAIIEGRDQAGNAQRTTKKLTLRAAERKRTR